jgi:hypothetical protein
MSFTRRGEAFEAEQLSWPVIGGPFPTLKWFMLELSPLPVDCPVADLDLLQADARSAAWLVLVAPFP